MNELPTLMSAEVLADPYAFYGRMHEVAPMRWDAGAMGVGCWLVALHEAVGSLLRDARLSADRSMAYRAFLPDTEDGRLVGATIQGALALKDPPDHTRLRGLVSRVFTPRAVEVSRPRIDSLVDELPARVADGPCDLMASLAVPLPVTVICELLGVPPGDTPLLRPWLDDYTMYFGAIKGLKRVLASMQKLHEYFSDLFRERRKQPKDDLLSALLAVEDAGDKLSAEELFNTVAFLFAAGQHTTTNLIGNGVLALVRNPPALRRLRENPGDLANGIEELLRFDSPVHIVGRVALEDIEVDGQRVEKGMFVLLMLGAANRDPRAFVDPDRLDLARVNASKHVAFGGGPHFCIGAPLARLEGAVAFSALFRRFRSIELAGEPEASPNLNFRGLTTLPLDVRSG